MRVSFDQACSLLKEGKVIGVPTETVYGLAASLHSPNAISQIFSLKGRPSNNPLITHLSDANEIRNYASELPKDFEKLANTFWPGPLTIIIPASEKQVPFIARAGLPTAAFRIPNHPLVQLLLKHVGPLVMPSANLSGKPSSTCLEHVETDFGKDFPVLDGGQCNKGVESTILLWSEDSWKIGRLGALASEDFLPVLGYSPDIILENSETQKKPFCPGQLFRHYAPNAHLILSHEFSSERTNVVIGFNNRFYFEGCHLFSLGNSFSPEEAFQNLYSILRQLDQEGINLAWVDFNIPNKGLWITLKERLLKASQCQTS